MITTIILSGALLSVSPEHACAIGEYIYRNECGSDPARLVFWKNGEQFPSCGIGHFIWLTRNSSEPFEGQFCAVLAYLKGKNIALPDWIVDYTCPWSNNDEWTSQLNKSRRDELQKLLLATKDVQAEFIIERFNQRLAKTPFTDHERHVITLLARTVAGMYALIDYAHFKGFGDNACEQYEQCGWGLLQVLRDMTDVTEENVLEKFIVSAKNVLARRVKNAPAARNEQQWLVGWHTRVDRYLCK